MWAQFACGFWKISQFYTVSFSNKWHLSLVLCLYLRHFCFLKVCIFLAYCLVFNKNKLEKKKENVVSHQNLGIRASTHFQDSSSVTGLVGSWDFSHVPGGVVDLAQAQIGERKHHLGLTDHAWHLLLFSSLQAGHFGFQVRFSHLLHQVQDGQYDLEQYKYFGLGLLSVEVHLGHATQFPKSLIDVSTQTHSCMLLATQHSSCSAFCYKRRSSLSSSRMIQIWGSSAPSPSPSCQSLMHSPPPLSPLAYLVSTQGSPRAHNPL